MCRAGALPFPDGAEFCYLKYLRITMQNQNFIHTYSYNQAYSPSIPSGKPSRWPKVFSKVARYLAIIGFLVLAVSYLPSVWYAIRTGNASALAQVLRKPVGDDFGGLMVESGDKAKDTYQPAFNPQLSMQPQLKISSIGVDTQVQEASYDNYESALKKSVWRVPDFGTPYQRNRPTILAAHRFGYLAWSNSYRRKNSFFNLPKLKEGDTIEIVWRQRKYVYEVYGESEGGGIVDYQADLILYTCKVLDSDVRIFKYARLLKI